MRTMSRSDLVSMFRAPGVERRQRLLATARAMLASHELDALSLADVAAAAGIPKGSAYHYYADIKDLYGQLLAIIDEEFIADLRRPLEGQRFDRWQQVVAALIARGEAFYRGDPAARQLVIGPKTPTDLKLKDRSNDVHLGAAFRDQIDARFVLPEMLRDSPIFFRAVEIIDLMFSLSILEHGQITDEMAGEAVAATTAYLACHLPSRLPRRRERPARR
jgi:AcrR family transcriptional regulator